MRSVTSGCYPRPMIRRVTSLLRALSCIGAATVAAGCGGTEREGPPNVVLCVVDTLRADHTSLLGYHNDTTPELAGFAAQGTVFDRAWSSCSWTLPSMSMLMTGRVRSDNGRDLPREHVPLAVRLTEEGYHTYGITSNALLLPGRGWSRGFEEYDVYVPDDDGRRARGWVADEVVDRALEMLDGHPSNAPFFLFCMFFDPHDPYTPVDGPRFQPQRSMERFEAFRTAVREEQRHTWTEEAYNGIESRIASYDAEVWQTDRALGRLFDELEGEGVLDETLVVVTSDHGEGLWTRPRPLGEEKNEMDFYGPLYMQHGLGLESEQVHVPLLVRGPGVPVGRVDERDVALIDVVPTLARLLDLDLEGRLDGLDLFEVDAQTARARTIPGFTSRGGSLLHEGRYRLHLPSDSRVRRFDAQPRLYDLATDPKERVPLDDETLVATLTRAFDAWKERGRIAEASEATTDAERAILDALGYTSGEAGD